MVKTPKEYFGIQRNVRGKRTRNPGFEPGNHWVECEVCASHIRTFDAKRRWDGLTVCPDDWETRHPQDFVRTRYDNIAASGLVKSESEDRFGLGGPGGVGIGPGGGDGTISIRDYSRVAIPLLDFIPGQAIPGKDTPDIIVVPITDPRAGANRPPTSTVPPGTFNPSQGGL